MNSDNESLMNELRLALRAEAEDNVRAALKMRADRVDACLRKARRNGLDVDADTVSRHLEWFIRWAERRIKLGTLMRRTGVKFKQPTT